jgi:hypothetical protein
MSATFTTNGVESGPCGHQHRTIAAAQKCLAGHDDRMVIRDGNTTMWEPQPGRWEPLV